MMNKKFLVVAFAIYISALVSVIDSSSDGVGEWHILTKLNFSSQIRLHPHILLIVTLPWSGEFRSLKKETSNLIRDRPDVFKSLNLMFMYKNVESMLANAVGATENEVTVLYYHHSVSYKYRGRLRARNILYSIHPYMWGLSEELPFKTLTSEEGLKAFVDSTDRALILFEFCGWAQKLMAMGKINRTENGFVGKGDLFGTGFQGETNRPLTFTEKNIHNVGLADAKMKCDVTNVFGGVPWVADFSWANGSAQFKETENISSGVSTSCAFEEHQKFDSFFSRFMSVARDFVLPPERFRSGFVSDRSMLRTLGIQDSGAWMVVLHFAGCPSCLKIVKNADELHNALQMDNSVITELEGDSHSMESALPADKPSVLLFVDRSSDSSETRRNSKEALSAFRELALSNHIKYQMVGQNGDRPGKSVQDSVHFSSISQHPKLKLSPKSKMIKLKKKMSTIMILNEDKHVTWNKQSSDLRSSLRDILESLHKNKDAKLSSLAKELGFQLLSDDIDIQLVNTLPSESETEADHVTPKLLNEDHIASGVNIDKYKVELPYEQHPVNSKVIDAELHLKHYEEKITYVDLNKQLKFAESELFAAEDKIDVVGHVKAGETGYSDVEDEIDVIGHVKAGETGYSDVEDEIDVVGHVKAGETGNSDVDKLGEQQLHHFPVFTGSFFFSDGNYRLVQSLTGELELPAVVIIDPVVQQHYVFPAEKNYSYSSLTDFLTKFLNRSLLPYQQSETALHTSREATQPPFVNLDFHEVDSIPRITCNTFSNLVLGFNQSDTDALNKDVLVLFSNKWCGFCQRMELVVREVYRAMKGYINMLQSGYRSGKTMFDGGSLKDAMLRLPLVYLLDCTLNDCSFILRSADQGEAYPALLLFPAERKNAIPYEGHMAVTDVIKFIANHGTHSQHLISENGILWSGAKKDRRNENISKAALSVDIEKEAPVAKEQLHEVMLTNRAPKRVIKYDQLKSHTSAELDEAAPLVVVGSILMATDKISAEPFAKSKILISKADRNNGFQGLIINKHMRWDVIGLEKGAEILGEAPLTFGGPLINHGMPLVALTRRIVNDQFPEVIPGIYFLDQIATLQEIEQLKSGNQSIADYWFFLGFSSWNWDQLFDEIAEGAWNVLDDYPTHFNWP